MITPKEKDLFDKITAELEKSTNLMREFHDLTVAAHKDACVHGTGIIEVKPDGSMRHVPYEETLKAARGDKET